MVFFDMESWNAIDAETRAELRKLDMEIAKRLGVTCQSQEYMDRTEYWLWRDGKHFGGMGWSEEDAWDEIPYYTTDLNAAASLRYDSDYWLQVSLNPDSKATAYARVLQNFSSGHGAIYGEADTEAHARSLCWLKWHKEKHGETPIAD